MSSLIWLTNYQIKRSEMSSILRFRELLKQEEAEEFIL